MLSNFYGARIKENRKRLKLSVDEFAAQLGVCRATQMNYESGKTTPSVDYIDRCAQVGIDPFELLVASNKALHEPGELRSDAVAVEIFSLLNAPSVSLDSPAGRTQLFQSLLRLVRRIDRGGEASTKQD